MKCKVGCNCNHKPKVLVTVMFNVPHFSLQVVVLSCMQDHQEVPVQALAALPVGTKHSPPHHTPSLHLQKRLPSQRSGRSNRGGKLGAAPQPPNWCSSSQMSTVLPHPQLLNSNPTHIPLRERGPADLQEPLPVSCFIFSLFISNYLYTYIYSPF